MPSSDAYWAGFFDAEGSVTVDDVSIVVQVTQGTLNILTLLKDRFYGYIQNAPNNKEKRFAWLWTVKSFYALDLIKSLNNSVLEKRDQMDLVQGWLDLSREEKLKRASNMSELNCGKYELKRLNLTERDDLNIIEYAAGFFDGDGNVGIYTGNKKGKPCGRPRLRIGFSQVNPSSVIFLFMKLGLGMLSYKKGQGNNRDQVKFVIRDESEAFNFLKLIQPFVIVKRNEVDLVLNSWDPSSLDSRLFVMDQLKEIRDTQRKRSLLNYKLWQEAGKPDKWVPPTEKIEGSILTEIKPHRTPKRDRIQDLLTDEPISTTEITLKVFGNCESTNRTNVHTALRSLQKVGLAATYKFGYWQKPINGMKSRVIIKDMTNRVLLTLKEHGGPCTLKELVKIINPPNPACVSQSLVKLKRKGVVQSITHGTWALTEGQES